MLARYIRVAARCSGVEHDHVVIHGDNKASIAWSSSYSTPTAVKYFLPELRWVQESMVELNARVVYIRSAANVADIGTKHLGGHALRPLRNYLLGYAHTLVV